MTDLDVRSQFGSLNAASPAAPSSAMCGLLTASLKLMVGDGDVEKNVANVRKFGHKVDGGSLRRDAILEKVAPKAPVTKPTASFDSAM